VRQVDSKPITTPAPPQVKPVPITNPAPSPSEPNITFTPAYPQAKPLPFTIPRYQEGGGVCGVNMSCAVEEKKSLPLYGTPDATELLWENGTIGQSRTRDVNGNPVEDIDFSDHGTPEQHSNPHKHNWEPKKDGTYDNTSRGKPINNFK